MESIQTYTQGIDNSKYAIIQCKIKELSIEFEGKGEVMGFHFKQLLKSDKAYVYQKTYEDFISYEVFERRENKQFNCISYPGSNSFGFWAWDYTDYNKALRKFNELSD